MLYLETPKQYNWILGYYDRGKVPVNTIDGENMKRVKQRRTARCSR